MSSKYTLNFSLSQFISNMFLLQISYSCIDGLFRARSCTFKGVRKKKKFGHVFNVGLRIASIPSEFIWCGHDPFSCYEEFGIWFTQCLVLQLIREALHTVQFFNLSVPDIVKSQKLTVGKFEYANKFWKRNYDRSEWLQYSIDGKVRSNQPLTTEPSTVRSLGKESPKQQSILPICSV